MNRKEGDRREGRMLLQAWGVSLIFHLLLFFLLAAAGFFLLVRPAPQDMEDVVQISLADGGASGSSRAEVSPPSAPAAPAPTVEISSDVKLPDIRQDYTEQPEKQREYRKNHREGAEGAAQSGGTTGAAGTPDAAGKSAGTGHADGGAEQGAGKASGAGGAETGSAPAPDEAPAVVDAGAYCTYRAVPQYPAGMIQAGASGRVTIEIEVSPESAVTSVEIVRSSGYGALDQAAVSAGWQCRFQMNGHPGRYRTTYRFELQGGDDW